jgi:hypothetical protein
MLMSMSNSLRSGRVVVDGELKVKKMERPEVTA